ncbi:unnamed protein product [Linum tenue]|uniref:Thioesterase domain-containing protein n=1 Tax=Linum tenue TaxID=586396 RepID=A0AAV0QIW3_9ROSI|nr:unnamed protein product [Linum tenue]CAI0545059.1 unnamed protein product [Linum tenue]
MTKDVNSATAGDGSTATETIARDIPLQYVNTVNRFFTNLGVSDPAVEKYTSTTDSYSDIIRGLLNVHAVERGRISCSFSVLPVVANFYKGLHGGAAAAVAERVSIACARTLVPEEKELFLGELGISYLSAAPQNETVTVDASVVRSGRNLTVVSMEFRQKKTGKLMFTARATFYHLPASKL